MKTFEEIAIDLDGDGFGHYLAGLIDGEGSFMIGSTANCQCQFTINLRDDDSGILYEIHRRTGLGTARTLKAYSTTTRTRTPLVRWAVSNQADCAMLVRLLDRYPLRAKKRNDFGIWRLAVREWLTRPPNSGWETMLALRSELISSRRYDSQPGKPTPEIIAAPGLFDASRV